MWKPDLDVQGERIGWGLLISAALTILTIIVGITLFVLFKVWEIVASEYLHSRELATLIFLGIPTLIYIIGWITQATDEDSTYRKKRKKKSKDTIPTNAVTTTTQDRIPQ